jgi:hydroxymethylpyrimidine/phosphomethylpyrimidine kinase
VSRAVRVVLSIAGSDSSAGAGIQADLKTFAAFGLYGVTAITAVTAQNTVGVTASMALPADLVTAQIEAVASDLPIAATKTGMLATAAVVEAVAAAIDELDLPLVVVDPVLRSSSGTALLDDDGVRMLRSELLPRARIVTPNIAEAEALSGRRIARLEDAKAAARAIRDLGASAVAVTGGHASGDEVVDLLYDGVEFVELRTPRVASRHGHGTGCSYASAVAAGLALGLPLVDAARRAQTFVAGALARGIHGALDHFWSGTKVQRF